MKFLRSIRREILVVAAAAAALLQSPRLIRLYDPTAGQLDGSIIQLITYAALLFLGSLLLLWFAIAAAFPSVNRYLDQGGFSQDFNLLTAAQRLCALLGIITLLLAHIALCLLTAHIAL